MNKTIISILLLLLSLHAMAEAETDSIGVARNSIFDPPQEEQVFFYHKDHLGSTLCITDRNGQIVERSEYIPYGEVFIDNFASDAEYETPYKFTGKEYDDETGLYYFGARYLHPKYATWLSVDPLATKYPNASPYAYCMNNPIKYVDPDGMANTDYISENGNIETINDGIDQVLKSSSTEINDMRELFDKDQNSYYETLKGIESTSSLGLTHAEFEKLSSAVYAESSGEYQESLGIVNVLKNRSSNEGGNLMKQVSDKSPYGVYGVRSNKYFTEIGVNANTKRSIVHRAIADGLTSKKDNTNGATFWDGTDIKTNSHYKVWGVTFTDTSHNLWKQKNTSGIHQLITTAAYNKTIFTKFKNPGSRWYQSR